MFDDASAASTVDAAPMESADSPAEASTGRASRRDPDLLAAAELCTELGCVADTRQVAPLLESTARILGAVGAIIWLWDSQTAELRPQVAHGYSVPVLAQIPSVQQDADNATAAAFRSAQACIVIGSDVATGALVVPLMTPAGCTGVLAIELPHGSEQSDSVRAVATIFAAQLARLFGPADVSQVVDRRLAYS
jgi:hypothetical protein